MTEAAFRERGEVRKAALGIFTLAQLRNANMSEAGVRRAVRRGDLERIGRGVYRSPDAMDDEMWRAGLRRNQMVYSHDTALYLHGLSDRDPLKYSVTVPTGYNTKRLTSEGFKVFSLKKELHGQDIEEAETSYGNKVRVYSLERTVCDCLRSRNRLQSEIVFAGLKGYVRRRDRNLSLLMRTAEKFGIASLLRTYLEVLL